MEIKLCGTEFGDFDIDNCPFQESPDLNNVRHTASSLGYTAEVMGERWRCSR